jgi:flagellin
MASILTNTSAMVALQTLKSTNKNMATIQNQISTGMKVSSAKDNGAVWAIASVMRSDVKGLGTVKEALSLGSATLGVARSASETVAELLSEAKERILGGGDLTNADTREKLLADLHAMGSQINTIVDSASFNGVNLLNASVTTQVGGVAGVAVVSSIARDDAGALTVETIDVVARDLSGIGGILLGWTEASFDNVTTMQTTLGLLEDELNTALDAATAFGTAQKQIDIQSNFVGKYVDALNSGIGAMVDADMEEASARLQALQVQQQLGIQALSIANQNPQNILALFR